MSCCFQLRVFMYFDTLRGCVLSNVYLYFYFTVFLNFCLAFFFTFLTTIFVINKIKIVVLKNTFGDLHSTQKTSASTSISIARKL